ncbi:MAG: HAMP domain-containing protein [Bacteroidales bacterium]|nr:HAMP domain-containing protein [Bacteroidales bacterium]
MSRRIAIRSWIAPALIVASALLLLVAFAAPRSVADTAAAARKVEKRLSRRMARLDYFAAHPQAALPDDMVIYTYEGDSLMSWRGQFPVYNDDIGPRMVVQRFTNPRVNLRSPLSYAEEEPVFMNIGAKWFIVKAVKDADKTLVCGLMVMNTMDGRSYNGVNPRLGLGLRFSVRPLTFSEGSAVMSDGRPVFKILCDSLSGPVTADLTLLWLSLLLFLCADVYLVYRRRSIRRSLLCSAAAVAALAAMYFWGRGAQTEFSVFSPVLYAGGSFLYSLGAVVLLNLTILICVLNIYLVRRRVWARAKSVPLIVSLGMLAMLSVLLILLYTHLSLRSISSNSGISLEIYKLGTLSVFTFLVYISYLSMLTAVPMLLQMLQPLASHIFGVHYDMFSARARSVLALATSLYLVLTLVVLGFGKEEDRMEVWAGKLAVDRDITLELRLLNIEHAIASDGVISALSRLEGSEVIVRNRIIDNYLLNESQDYSVVVRMLRPGMVTPVLAEQFENVVRNGVPISDGSAFMSMSASDGILCSYRGIFTYYHPGGPVYMLLEVDLKDFLAGKAYSRLLNYDTPGRANLPSAYSCSRYHGRELRFFEGEYPYSTVMDDWMYAAVYTERLCHFKRDGYVHFVTVITDDEAVIISRREIEVFSYIVAAFFIAIAMYVLLRIFVPRRRRDGSGETYLRTRISLTLMMSLILSLVVMATVSVLFVYRRNEANRQAIMSGRINSIQMLAQGGLRSLDAADLLRSAEFASLIQSVSDNSGADISVYSTDGRIVLCTNPEALDRMLVGYRIEPEALERIVKLNKRYCTIREHLGWRHYYNMYMPLIGADGHLLAVICSPYVEESYDFERDAIMHSTSVIAVFLLLFILSRLMEAAVLDRVFRPLSMMRQTMKRAGHGDMGHISYGRRDEITTLVDAYNRMVDELSESSRRLALAERDKAWSSMARQVAHEIKNPLTPMRLQIQRLIRLKDKGDPSWQDKFDDVSRMLLDHIDILTETSNEFSTFAKLYTQESVPIDIDALLQEEMSMFDGRDDVEFRYIGMSGAMIYGPRPQLTRVLVNLLNNAVQAVEGKEDAKVYVSLRKSSAIDGWYDIVIEDNGPGVSEENVPKLFTPHFTTKSGGTGLGLAISRSVLEKCGALIGYSKSFTLGGACFTVSYPADGAQR